MAGGQESALSLQLQIDEIKNSIFHLERSNKELEDVLAEDPGDVDFMEAIAENLIVVDRKRAQVAALQKKLMATAGHKCGADCGHTSHQVHRIALATAPRAPPSFADVPSRSPTAFDEDGGGGGGGGGGGMPFMAAMGEGDATATAAAAGAVAAGPPVAAMVTSASDAAAAEPSAAAEEVQRPGISL